MRRRKFISYFVWATVLACLFCIGLNTAAVAESEKLTVRVMTRNMDAGTDLNYVTGATDTATFVAGVLATIAEVDASNIPGRASLLAAEIAEAKPDLIALQEVTVWNISDAGGPRTYDQLGLLMAALDAAHQHYRVAALQPLTEIPVAIPGLFSVKFTDQNAILIRTDVPPGHLDLTGTETHLYENFLSFELPVGEPVPAYNGWMAVDVKIRGARFKFANTHLLSPIPVAGLFEITSGVQVLQAGELLDGLSSTGLPIILAGDFNSDAEVPQHAPDETPTAGLISESYTDTWHSLHPSDHGYTWSLFLEDQTPPSMNGQATVPFERIDLIFSKGPEVSFAERTGLTVSPQGLFASDHAGVVADFDLQNHRPDVPKGKP